MKKEVKIKSPWNLIRVKFQRKYIKYGYIYRREIVDDTEYGGTGEMETVTCYSLDTGHWIGNPRSTRCLCKKHGLRQIQKAEPNHCVASIGFSEEEQKWYGWSHRAIFGFGINDEVFTDNSSEDCSLYQNFLAKMEDRLKRKIQVIKTLKEAKESAKNFAKSVS